MPFPSIKRVIYKNSPLVEVIFQARYPRFLLIETEAPAEFQRRVIAEYPMYEQRNVFQIVLASSQERNMAANEVTGRMHVFASKDRVWTIAVVGDYFSVSTSRYVRWEEFRTKVETALKIALDVYQFPIFTRIGLRYQDVISREQLGLEKKTWAELLQPHVAGEFSTSEVTESSVTSKETVLTMKLGGGDNLLFRHGLVTHKDTQKLAYLIDSDFFNEEQRTADINGALQVADRLHANSGRFFRWCISDALHLAMEPSDAG